MVVVVVGMDSIWGDISHVDLEFGGEASISSLGRQSSVIWAVGYYRPLPHHPG